MSIGWDSIWELFHFAILSALIAGLVCPLIGAFLLVRRTGFYGVALPQFAAAGISFGYAILGFWITHIGLAGMSYAEAIESPHALRNYVIGWATVFTFGGLGLLAWLGKRKELETGHVAAAFAIASALAVLCAKASPVGLEVVDTLLHGEILVVSRHDFETIVVAYVLVLALLVLFYRDFLLISFDAETALVLKKPVRRFEILLTVLVGLTVSVGVRIVGPIVLFGLLVIPPLAAQGLARSMAGYLLYSAGSGLVAAVLGIYGSFRLDLPLGPAMVMAAALVLVLVTLVRRFLRR